jgi:cell division protein ZapA
LSSRKHIVKVRIVGDEYSLRSDAEPAHAQAVAEYVDEAIRKVMNSGTVIETHKAAILAALQITDELFAHRARASDLSGSMDTLSGEIRRWLPPAKRGS